MSMYKLCRPTDALAAEFQHLLSQILGNIIANVHESHTLAALRVTLHFKLMSGELRLAEVVSVAEA